MSETWRQYNVVSTEAKRIQSLAHFHPLVNNRAAIWQYCMKFSGRSASIDELASIVVSSSAGKMLQRRIKPNTIADAVIARRNITAPVIK